jgi:TrmH family RNA methyltransferase
MAELCVILVEPKHQCNVGFVARAMGNFGYKKLYFSGRAFMPDQEAYDCAAHAGALLKESEHLGKRSINEMFDFVIGTTAKPHMKESSPRIALTPKELAIKLSEIEGRIALLFGREDSGLSNKELEVCDIVVSIPASSEYATLNISHAAAILFYELRESKSSMTEIRIAEGKEKEALLKRLSLLLDTVDYPNYKKKVAKRIFRKVIGRAGISSREAHTLAGIFKEADDKIKRI